MKFDRIDGEFVAATKDIPFSQRHVFRDAGWRYARHTKSWRTTDYDSALVLRKFAVGAAKEHIDNVESLKDTIVEASKAEDYDGEFPCPEGLAYRPFQKAGIAYALEGDNTLFADPPGLGKTVQAVGVHNVEKFSKILIVCPASLKLNWKREWHRWDVHKLTVGLAESQSRTKTVQGIKKSYTDYMWPDTDVIIVNYDMLETFDDKIKEVDWDCLIVDECHNLKNKDAIRTKAVFGGYVKPRKNGEGKVIKPAVTFTEIRTKFRLFLTGTPVLSKPEELWVFLRAFDPKGLGKDWTDFIIRYCAAEWERDRWKPAGASNEEELQRILRSRFMVRRDKRSVLSELPPKTREIIFLPHDKLKNPLKKERTKTELALAEYERLVGLPDRTDEFWYINLVEGLYARLSDAMADVPPEDWEAQWKIAISNLTEPEQILFTELAAAREEVALAKTGMVVEHVKRLYESGEPVLLFAYHKSVVKELYTQLEKLGMRVAMITGDTPIKKRQQVVDDYQDGLYDVVIGNIMAMGVGFTMTRGSTVVFAELDWVPALIEQAEDRAWRIGQENAVLIQFLLVDGSIEARMCVRLVEKMEIIKKVLDSHTH